MVYETNYNADNYVDALDIDENNHVNFLDMETIEDSYGASGTPGWIRADVNADGTINALDISAFLGAWNNGTDNYTVSIEYESDSYVGYTYYHSSNFPAVDWLHAYDQFTYETYMGHSLFALSSAYEMALEGDVDYTNWEETDNGYNVFAEPDNKSWNTVRFTTYNDTVAFLDNMTICTTPYDVTPQAVYPVMDSTVDIVDDQVMHNASFNILNNSVTPLFADSQVYVWKDVGAEVEFTIDIYGDDYYMEVINEEYEDAVNYDHYQNYYFNEEYLKVGQEQIGDDWYIYRTALEFDTSVIDETWNLVNARVILTPIPGGNGVAWNLGSGTPPFTWGYMDSAQGTY